MRLWMIKRFLYIRINGVCYSRVEQLKYFLRWSELVSSTFVLTFWVDTEVCKGLHCLLVLNSLQKKHESLLEFDIQEELSFRKVCLKKMCFGQLMRR